MLKHLELLYARSEQATRFLDSVLIPTIRQGKHITEEKLNELIAQFKDDHPGPGDDFETGHIWGIAYKRALIYKCLAKKGSTDIPPDAEVIEQVLDLLTELA
jgi:hypothetical protein